MDVGKFQVRSQPFSSIFTFRVEQNENGSLVASVLQRDPVTGNSTTLHRYHHHYHHVARTQDDVGALYYVVAVIFIYGCSILMMIASYIRKNKVDRRLNRYLKEMANVRKRERRMTLMSATAKVAKKDGLVLAEAGSANCTPSPSPNATPSGRGSTASGANDTGPSGSVADVTSLSGACRHQSTSKSASFQFLAVDPSFSLAEVRAGRRLVSRCPRASSPVLVVSNHQTDDDDEYNGDSDCSGLGCHGSDRSNSASDLRASGMSLNIPPISVHGSPTSRRHRQCSTAGSSGPGGKRRKSVKLCVPGSPLFLRGASDCQTPRWAESTGHVTTDVRLSSHAGGERQPETPTSIGVPEFETPDIRLTDDDGVTETQEMISSL